MGAIKAANPNMPFAAYTPPEGIKVDVSDPQKITEKIKKVAAWFGADLVGICKLDKRWVYSHTYSSQPYSGVGTKLQNGESQPQEIPEEFQCAVVMAFAQDYDIIKYFPTNIASAATSMGYSRMAVTNSTLSAFIRNLGFKAIDCSTNDVALSIPMAMQAGLGELGRFGLLITRKYGPNVRLSKVITDLPLVADVPVDFGVTQFCESSEICAEMCPSQSIMYGERTTEPNNISNVGGVLKWPVNAETCRTYWSHMNKPCTLCVGTCPYTKPNTLFHRLIRWMTDHARWGDPLYVWGDRLFGYSKPRDPDKFWEEWQPGRNGGWLN
jgi:reductive dehalogenase